MTRAPKGAVRHLAAAGSKTTRAPRTSPPRTRCQRRPLQPYPTARRDRREGPSATSRSDTRGIPKELSTRPRRPAGRLVVQVTVAPPRRSTPGARRDFGQDRLQLDLQPVLVGGDLAVGDAEEDRSRQAKPGRGGNHFVADAYSASMRPAAASLDTPPHRRSPPPPAPISRARRVPMRWRRGRASRRPGEPQPRASAGRCFDVFSGANLRA